MSYSSNLEQNSSTSSWIFICSSLPSSSGRYWTRATFTFAMSSCRSCMPVLTSISSLLFSTVACDKYINIFEIEPKTTNKKNVTPVNNFTKFKIIFLTNLLLQSLPITQSTAGLGRRPLHGLCVCGDFSSIWSGQH